MFVFVLFVLPAACRDRRDRIASHRTVQPRLVCQWLRCLRSSSSLRTFPLESAFAPSALARVPNASSFFPVSGLPVSLFLCRRPPTLSQLQRPVVHRHPSSLAPSTRVIYFPCPFPAILAGISVRSPFARSALTRLPNASSCFPASCLSVTVFPCCRPPTPPQLQPACFSSPSVSPPVLHRCLSSSRAAPRPLGTSQLRP